MAGGFTVLEPTSATAKARLIILALNFIRAMDPHRKLWCMSLLRIQIEKTIDKHNVKKHNWHYMEFKSILECGFYVKEIKFI